MTFTDAEFPSLPYPGARPTLSFVHDRGTGRPLHAEPGAGWRWTVAGAGVDTFVDLDAWLAERDAEPLDTRIPVLAYGSNANPTKITWLRDTLGLTGPAVVLRVRCTDLAAVWAAGRRVVDDQRPATLRADPGRVEWHALWLATAEQVRVLDVCEGRGVRYRLVRLDSGTVTDETGTTLPGVLAYTGAGEIRWPLLVNGTPARCAEVPQADAMRLIGEPGPDGLTVTPLDGAPNAGDWPDRLFVYGTLRPDDRAWHRIAPHAAAAPEPTQVTGTLHDTGHGYPALCPGQGSVRGWTIPLRSPATAFTDLDAYEGPEYRRTRVIDSTGRLCWTYLWSAPTQGLRQLPDGWPATR
jgi:gamma-glutamylcyclotransferase (GGCT)/AIG2-like uncharacterized protein YtfP